MKRRIFLVALLVAGGCGGPAAPDIKKFTLDHPNVKVGIDAFALVAVHAPDGDIDRGEVALRAKEKDGDTEVSTRIPVEGVAPHTVDATLVVDMSFSGDFPAGAYDLDVIVRSNAMKASDSRTVALTLFP